MKFYYVNKDYLDYIRSIDDKVMQIKEGDVNKKMVFGVVFSIKDFDYYIPLSSIKKETQLENERTLKKHLRLRCHPVKEEKENDEGRILALLRCDFMFPVPKSEIIDVNIEFFEKKYKDLVNKQYIHCKTKKEKIKERALSVYDKALKPNHPLNGQCCDFLALEHRHNEWLKQKVITQG